MTPEKWQEIKKVVNDALELDAGERATFLDCACANSSSLRKEVEALLASDREAGTDFLNERPLLEIATTANSTENLSAPSDSWIGRRVGTYKIIERIGVGGFGEVYRAFRADDQYRMEVALKVIRGGEGSRFVVNRFKTERQILASLDHPNIARLHDGGTTEDGVPYFVMELIDGRTIDQYCELHHLPVNERLKLFLQVCAAVQYAHQRLIIHRDIKPSNILVTSEGTPKLLDFGIAKILDGAALPEQFEPTLTMFRLLTPGYASPEQIKGEPITTASDVYSLGVVLYELLTGRHPYRGPINTPQEIARAVCEVEPEKPSTVIRRRETTEKRRDSASAKSTVDATAERRSKRLRGDLDNIVMMALRKAPQRRYASAEQFAEDIRRHLGSLPVVARTDTFVYRTSKFLNRHKAGVIAAAVIAATVLAALWITVREARIARAQQTRAERRFNDVRKLANSLIFEIHDSIETMPGATPTRKLLLERALEYLDSLARESNGDVSLQRELSAAYLRIGSLQGSTLDASLGQSNDALVSFRKAVAIREAVVKADPSNVSDRLNLAIAHHALGRMLSSANQPGAREQADQALAITGQLVKEGHQSSEVQGERAIEFELLSDLQGGSGDAAGQLESMKQSLAIGQDLLKTNPQDRKLQRGVAIGDVKVGYALAEMGSRAEAMQSYESGLDTFEILAKNQTDARSRRELAVATAIMAGTRLANGEWEAALAASQRALAITEALAKDDPQNATLQLDLAGGYLGVGSELLYVGKYSEAEAALERASRGFSEVLAHNPADQQAPHYMALIEIWLGESLLRSGKTQAALQRYEKGISALDVLGSGDPDVQSEAASARVRLGMTLAMLGRPREAAEAYRKALAIAESLVAAKPPNIRALYAVADANFEMGELTKIAAEKCSANSAQCRTRWTEAHDWYDKAATAWNEVPNPGAVTPSNLPCGNPLEVNRAIAQCNTALAKLGN